MAGTFAEAILGKRAARRVSFETSPAALEGPNSGGESEIASMAESVKLQGHAIMATRFKTTAYENLGRRPTFGSFS